MKITAPDLKKMGIVDCILSEEKPVTRKNLHRVTGEIRGKNRRFSGKRKGIYSGSADGETVSAIPEILSDISDRKRISTAKAWK